MPSNSPRTSPHPAAHRRPKLLFYHVHDPHYGFTNFSAHPVQYKGKRYPTSEHLFQAFKFLDTRPDIAEKIRKTSEFPRDAFNEARNQQAHVRPDWKDVKIAMMDIAIEHKFTQHNDLKEELLMSADAELVEDSAEDAFWGIGKDGKGRNELGKALERLRTKLRSAQRPVILFYEQRNPYYSFTNLSPHAVAFNGEMYPTSEHLFQAFKFLECHPDVAQKIRLCKKPSDAWAEAARHKTKIRADWHGVHVEKMDIVLWQKFNQHPQLKEELLATGDADLVEARLRAPSWRRF
ncbi:hypothetical protein B0H16DRAFT_1537045 [Mycena metata]|uniref:NADAR domain-containing protein n=1 Tax=Mycena metata TaxID=1033252 RepID=A0AAD7J5E5_9AGAR|nr:hypothetical protein B0H16DRAFT_1537045 [Mycena metata]